MRIIWFEQFRLRYSGASAYVVGRGPTRFDYQGLGDLKREPVFLINDAVQLEHHLRTESFYFATDANQRYWLSRPLRSTAVVPLEGKIVSDRNDTCFHAGLTVCFYYWASLNRHRLLRMDRETLAQVQMLYRGTGTIHCLLHFAWFAGIEKVHLIGCDGLNDPQWLRQEGLSSDGYDPRIVNRSESHPWWQYSQIRLESEELCQRLGMEYEFVGSPL